MQIDIKTLANAVSGAYENDPDCWDKADIDKYEKLLKETKEIVKGV